MVRRFLSGCVLLAGWLAGGYGLRSSSISAASAEQLQKNSGNNDRSARPGDPVARLQQRLERGEAQLEYAEPGGYLQAVLKRLRVPVSSQGLVFSKTSFQSNYISPANPRAIYFNDEVYVGWIRGGELIEISTVDPLIGGVFYALEQKPSAAPKIVRNETCMRCHVAGSTRYIPGHLVRSVFPEATGNSLANLGSFVTDHTSPFKDRWGGWYVTGTLGAERHLGNLLFTDDSNPDQLEPPISGNLKSLDQRVDLRTVDLHGYASPHSDIVALMVLAHQTQMQNMIVWLGYETRMALHQQEGTAATPEKWSAETRWRIHYAADELLKYLLFADEARLRAPVTGTSGFAAEFVACGPKDRAGRSLREFDLKQRLFRYPCSYLIYSAAFDGIPKPALDYLYRRLWLVLTGQAQEKEFAALSAADRRAILEILRETKPNLPEYFRTVKE